jgi:hypothetical protein
MDANAGEVRKITRNASGKYVNSTGLQISTPADKYFTYLKAYMLCYFCRDCFGSIKNTAVTIYGTSSTLVEPINAYRMLVGKPLPKRPVRKLTSRRKDIDMDGTDLRRSVIRCGGGRTILESCLMASFGTSGVISWCLLPGSVS